MNSLGDTGLFRCLRVLGVTACYFGYYLRFVQVFYKKLFLGMKALL
jgi:hypothetical protein